MSKSQSYLQNDHSESSKILIIETSSAGLNCGNFAKILINNVPITFDDYESKY